jgi:hypothetical protein
MYKSLFFFLALSLLSLSPTSVSADFDLDIDDDGKSEALTDGLLVIRYTFGFTGESLVADAISSNAARSTAPDIEAYLKANEIQLDVDGDGEVAALSDGLLIIRSLFGFSGTSLSADAIGTNARRTDGAAIASYIETIQDSDNDDTNDAFDAFPSDAAEWLDTDNDGTGNNTDDDDDNDGVADTADAFPLDSTESVDTDNDGIGNNADTSNNLAGRVIDGYVSGATAFLDLNFDGLAGSNEPSTISDADGNFVFSLDDSELQCASYVPTVVNVPVGAEDSDSGPVTEAYQMTLPPRFIALSVGDVLNVTPITSAVWEALESQLRSTTQELSCTTITESQSEVDGLIALLEAAVADVVSHYNIAEAELFADYIAEGNAEVQETAVKIVKGLKKSLTETALLAEQYPNASWAKVNYYFFSSLDGDNLYPNAWYRDLELFNDGVIIKELIKVSDDLAAEVRPIVYEKTTISTIGEAILREEIGYESRGGDDSDYNCSFKEELSTVSDGAEYQIVNLGSILNVQSIDTCRLPDFSTQASSRYIFYKSVDNGIDAGAQFTFDRQSNSFPALNDWFNFVDNVDDLDLTRLVVYVNELPYGFCEAGAAGATSVNRSRSTMVSGNQVTLNRAENGVYERITIFEDGTSLTELSTIDSMPGWDDCPASDYDADGLPDSIDPDDDGDGVADTSDAFPLDSTESVDTDLPAIFRTS